MMYLKRNQSNCQSFIKRGDSKLTLWLFLTLFDYSASTASILNEFFFFYSAYAVRTFSSYKHYVNNLFLWHIYDYIFCVCFQNKTLNVLIHTLKFLCVHIISPWLATLPKTILWRMIIDLEWTKLNMKNITGSCVGKKSPSISFSLTLWNYNMVSQ